MKSAKEWLETLKEPYRSRALKNYDPDFVLGKTIENLSSAILRSFSWRKSSEGSKYWDDIYNRALIEDETLLNKELELKYEIY